MQRFECQGLAVPGPKGEAHGVAVIVAHGIEPRIGIDTDARDEVEYARVPEAFFPEKGGSTREAKRICSGCEVRAECLEYALANDERFGIWGGLSERERRRVRRQRALERRARAVG